ncbi:hypothetical protein HLB44_29790 [Aquincola sp. S2]|uniref:Uncharacterized protein n=1 Tax=Pseudaquabacterium terrae TaxID=2732868 RepID=A0ABX2ERD4_9BURK|nr:hypothetical protein [Aquabacterium terrae]NRF71193.1 hypothetical protein [Aquabacterium terrae]
MSSIRSSRRWPAHVLIGSLLGLLAHAAGAARPDPLDPQALVPRLTHESAFKQYRGQHDEKLRSWKEANDEVGRIGGWRAYAREAQQPDKVAAPASAASGPTTVNPPASQPAPRGGGHQHH